MNAERNGNMFCEITDLESRQFEAVDEAEQLGEYLASMSAAVEQLDALVRKVGADLCVGSPHWLAELLEDVSALVEAVRIKLLNYYVLLDELNQGIERYRKVS